MKCTKTCTQCSVQYLCSQVGRCEHWDLVLISRWSANSMKGEISKGFASLPGLSTQAKYLMSLTLLVEINVDVSKSKQPKPTNRPTRSSNNTPDTYWEDTDSIYHRYSHMTVHCSTIYNGDIVEPMCSQSEKWTWRMQCIYTCL